MWHYVWCGGAGMGGVGGVAGMGGARVLVWGMLVGVGCVAVLKQFLSPEIFRLMITAFRERMGISVFSRQLVAMFLH
jgi:hypothetical protein